MPSLLLNLPRNKKAADQYQRVEVRPGLQILYLKRVVLISYRGGGESIQKLAVNVVYSIILFCCVCRSSLCIKQTLIRNRLEALGRLIGFIATQRKTSVPGALSTRAHTQMFWHVLAQMLSFQ